MTHEAPTMVLDIETRPQTPGGGFTNPRLPIHRAAEGSHQASRGIFWLVQAPRRRKHTMRTLLLSAPCTCSHGATDSTRLRCSVSLPVIPKHASRGGHGLDTSKSARHDELEEHSAYI